MLALATILIGVRRRWCQLRSHDDRTIPPDSNDVWLSGDRMVPSSIRICRRCLTVTRRTTHGKNARL